ncbi:MAG: peptidoglycan-binding domain-containing protein [Bryobacteraceae bacterium]
MHLRKAIAIVAAGLACSAGLLAATTATQKKKPAPKHHSKHAPSKAKKAPAHATHTTSRSGQTEPTPERYKQFQEALIAKGYLHGEATGKWDEASADAMRRFQKDQNLEPTGKPNQSLSIIALGLGPKR